MSNQDLNDLFKPGSGVVPPYLAGRKREQKFFRNCVSALKNEDTDRSEYDRLRSPR